MLASADWRNMTFDATTVPFSDLNNSYLPQQDYGPNFYTERLNATYNILCIGNQCPVGQYFDQGVSSCVSCTPSTCTSCI